MARLSLTQWLDQQRSVIQATKAEFEDTLAITAQIGRNTDLNALWKQLEKVMSDNPNKDIVVTFINADTRTR